MTETATARAGATTQVHSITPVLTFKSGTGEAIDLSVSLFPKSRLLNMVRSDGGLIPAGEAMMRMDKLDIAELRAAYNSPA